MSTVEPSVLDRIVEGLRKELVERRLRVPLHELWARCQERPPARSLSAALRGETLRLIAEVKRASPSAGALRDDLDAVTTARLYRENGAAAVSVLTEERHFRGSLEDLTRIVETFERDAEEHGDAASRLPVLRKDFIFHPYQLYEARAAGADAVLLIVAILSDGQLHEFLHVTEHLGMEALVEVHDEQEVERALAAGARLIGINNRDLRTFVTDLRTTERLRPLIPNDCVVVSESGIGGAEQAALVRGWGVDAILVGEAIVTARDMAAKIRELASVPTARGMGTSR
jgi:indole-3-glycerol phosphate synthase